MRGKILQEFRVKLININLNSRTGILCKNVIYFCNLQVLRLNSSHLKIREN